MTSDVNDTEILRILVFDVKPRLSFSKKKKSPNRAEAIAK